MKNPVELDVDVEDEEDEQTQAEVETELANIELSTLTYPLGDTNVPQDRIPRNDEMMVNDNTVSKESYHDKKRTHTHSDEEKTDNVTANIEYMELFSSNNNKKVNEIEESSLLIESIKNNIPFMGEGGSRKRFRSGTVGAPIYAAFGSAAPKKSSTSTTDLRPSSCAEVIIDPSNAMKSPEAVRSTGDMVVVSAGQRTDTTPFLFQQSGTEYHRTSAVPFFSPAPQRKLELEYDENEGGDGDSQGKQGKLTRLLSIRDELMESIKIFREYKVSSVNSSVLSSDINVLAPSFMLPPASQLRPLTHFNLPTVVSSKPFYSNRADIPDGLRQGKASVANSNIPYDLKGDPAIECFHANGDLNSFAEGDKHHISIPLHRRLLQPSFAPPVRSAVLSFGPDETTSSNNNGKSAHGTIPYPKRKSQLDTPTQTKSPVALLGMKTDRPTELQSSKIAKEPTRRNVSVLSMEIFCNTRKDLLPNPKFDAVECVIWALEMDSDISSDDGISEYSTYSKDTLIWEGRKVGIAIMLPYPLPGQVQESPQLQGDDPNEQNLKLNILRNQLIFNLAAAGLSFDFNVRCRDIIFARSEHELLVATAAAIRRLDPDFLVGYEVQRSSIGYLIDRAKMLNPPVPFLQLISRAPEEDPSSRNEFDKYGQEHESGIWVTGRTVLNLWRRMKSELKLDRYTIQYVVLY